MYLIFNRKIIISLLILSLLACSKTSNFDDVLKLANQGDAVFQALVGEAYANGKGELKMIGKHLSGTAKLLNKEMLMLNLL